jgi:methylenetetrahydrofolate reductase (NADPH)
MTPDTLTAGSATADPRPATLPVRLEVIPTDGIVDSVRANLPAGTALTITCLPHHGPARTVQTAVELAGLGFEVVPHLAARGIESRTQLAAALRQCTAAGITDVFAVGGDAPDPAGPYTDCLMLLREIADLSGGSISAGVAGYPEGHPRQSELHMLDSLLEKQHLASSVVTQMCFSAPRIRWYAETLRREGVQLPIWAGVAGAVPRAKLIALAARIGVGPSLKFLSRQGPLGRRLLSGNSYSPAPMLERLSAIPELGGVHLYTFNNLVRALP